MVNQKKIPIFKIVILLIVILEGIVLSGVIIYLMRDSSGETDKNAVLDYSYSECGKYVLYIGLNDKNTYTQEIATDDAVRIVNSICTKYADGYTMQEAKGGWVDEAGTLTEEMSLVYTLSSVEEEAVISIMDEVLTVLNQNSILIERQNISYTYYSGK